MSSKENQEPEESANRSNDAEEVQQSESDSQLQRGTSNKAEDQIDSGKLTLEEKLSAKMFTYARETICFFLAIAFTTLAVLHSLPPRISRPPIAKPFFDESSVVLDFYKGHLSALVERVTDSDFSFVMYYAPWDAECQVVKEQFEKVANYYHPRVFFAAINCWHPGSECRTRYSKIQSYPVLMLYPSRESGIQYKGIRTASYMIRFIHSSLNPIARITNDIQLMELLRSNDAVIIGYFHFSSISNTPGYKEFYKAALRILEKDPNREIAFAAITSLSTAAEHGVTRFPSASLLMWNETLFYPENNQWVSEVLLYWINNVAHRVVTWLQPPGIKSFTFAQYLWDGPVLFLFTPRSPLHFENQNYNLLREIGLQYYDCSGNLQIEDVVSRLRANRLKALQKFREKQHRCKYILDRYMTDIGNKNENKARVNDFQHHMWAPPVTTKCCEGVPTNQCVMCTKRNPVFEYFCLAPGAACRGIDIFDLEGLNSVASQKFDTRKEADDAFTCSADSCDFTTEFNEETDPHSASAVREAFYVDDCSRFVRGVNYYNQYKHKDAVMHYNDTESNPEVNLTESICKTNKTLALVAIDSLNYFHFAESLGIDLANTTDKTAVVILDPDDESQYVMEGEFTRNRTVEFINNYTNGDLRRTMRSHNPKQHTRTKATRKFKHNNKSKVYVPELTTETFLKIVLNPNKDVVIMYHSPYCAFCSVVTYVYLTVAHYLSMMDHLEFVRIDGDNNDLPWEYTMDRYPSILFFPAKRKEDSTLFPWTLPVSVGNLLSFVLANLDAESHLEALINVCAAGAEGSPAACLSRVRWLCLDIFEEHLKDFRRLRREKSTRGAERFLDARRRILLLKLQHVREAHLALGTTDNLVKDEEKVRILRKKFKKFYAKLANLWRDGAKLKYSTATSDEGKMKQNSS